MHVSRASRTAEVMALFRAIETTSGTNRLFADELASRFLNFPLNLFAAFGYLPWGSRAVASFLDRQWPGARTSAVSRTRYIDDLIENAVRQGATQLVVLGAGFDTRSVRLPYLQRIPVFELDHVYTGKKKQRRLGSAAVLGKNVRQIGVDLNRETPESALRAAGADFGARTVVLWEGVTQYLDREAVDLNLRCIAGFLPMSELIVTYVDATAISGEQRFHGYEAIKRVVRSHNEPWVFGIRPEELRDYLAAHGLSLLSDLNAAQYRALYSRYADARGYEFYHVAHARIGRKFSAT